MKKISLIIVLVVIASCTSTKHLNEKPSEALKTLISENTFIIFSQWADPQFSTAMYRLRTMGFMQANNIAGRIDISGNNNYFIFRNDSIIGHFPYYGERHMGSSHSNIDQGIQFEGLPENLEVEQEGSIYKMSFRIKDTKARNETYDVRIRLNSNLSSIIDITSTHRNSIRYEGRILLKDDEDATM